MVADPIDAGGMLHDKKFSKKTIPSSMVYRLIARCVVLLPARPKLCPGRTLRHSVSKYKSGEDDGSG
jgi:hypothetical protein